MLFRPLVCGVIRSGRERETRNENYRVEREGDPFGHAPAFAESNRDFRSPPRESPSGASSTGRNARQPGAPSSDTRVRFSCAETGEKMVNLRHKVPNVKLCVRYDKYVCYFARVVRLHACTLRGVTPLQIPWVGAYLFARDAIHARDTNREASLLRSFKCIRC